MSLSSTLLGGSNLPAAAPSPAAPSPSRIIRILACLFLCTAAAAQAIDVGDSYEKVLAEKGAPKSLIDAGAVKVLSYPDATIKVRENVVVSIKVIANAPAKAAAPTRAPAQAPTREEQVALVKRQMKDAIARVNLIVNQPVPTVPRTKDMKGLVPFGDAWFHPGAVTPDFNAVDIRKTQDTSKYEPYAYVTSNLNPDVAFPGGEVEFNPMTKFFYIDRSLPKKKLTEPEMLEINRLYRIIGGCEGQLSLLGEKQ